jgi:outer membrane protein TolC
MKRKGWNMNRLQVPVSIVVFLLLVGGTLVSGEPQGEGFSLRDAIRITLEKQPSIKAAMVDIAAQKARLNQVRGAFDRVLSMSLADTVSRSPLTVLERSAIGVGHTYTDNYLMQIGLSRQNRSGIRIMPSIQFGGTRNSPTANARTPDLLGQGSVHLTVVAPLARGRKNDLTAATEKSTIMDVSASTSTARFQARQAVFQTIVAYWNLQTAEDRLDVQQQAFQRGTERVQNLRQAIPEGQAPSAEVLLAEADLADSRADILSFEQGVIEARTALGIALGISEDQVFSLGKLTTSFQEEEWVNSPAPPLEGFIRLGLAQRQDLAALQERKKSAENLLPALRSQTKPRLDLSVDVGYNGLSEGGPLYRPTEALYKRVPGANWTVQGAYEFPLENRSALGALQQQKEMVALLTLQVDDLIRTIKLNIQAAYIETKQQCQVIQQLTQVIEKYHRSLQNEEEKRKKGDSKVLDSLNIEDRLVGAELKKRGALQSLALSLARLQMETGGNIFSLGQDGDIDLAQLIGEGTSGL